MITDETESCYMAGIPGIFTTKTVTLATTQFPIVNLQT